MVAAPRPRSPRIEPKGSSQEYGLSAAQKLILTSPACRKAMPQLVNRASPAAQKDSVFRLTLKAGRPYIRVSARRPLSARLRASEAPHWNSESASDGYRVRGGSTLSGLLGKGAHAPGCLKIESEERETWTAGSLRIASRGEAILPGVRSLKRLRRYTFKVHRDRSRDRSSDGPRQVTASQCCHEQT